MNQVFFLGWKSKKAKNDQMVCQIHNRPLTGPPPTFGLYRIFLFQAFSLLDFFS